MASHTWQGTTPGMGTLAALRRHAAPLTDSANDYDRLLELVGDSRFTLLGEATHGTHEFYHERVRITQRLILEHGYNAVAVEADWPDAYRVNRYVRGASDDPDADAALSGFARFPTWMWRNTVVLEFVEWLRSHNATRPEAERVGFYGIDLYSLSASVAAVLKYLDATDPEAARRARFRYACFDHFGENMQAYGYAATFGMRDTCERQVIEQLSELTRAAGAAARRDGRGDPDEFFFAEQNARLVKNAEEYYRTMFKGRVSSWNVRDRHMTDTLQALDRHLSRGGTPARIAVWAHNSHLGDASATEMGDGGEWNVGELMREAYGRDAVLIGFSTHRGSVTAASDWGGPAERKLVRPALAGSYEMLFHDSDVPRFLAVLRDNDPLSKPLSAARLERAIGVIYLPESERISHYFHARLANQFDAVIHIDETRALVPLESGAEWMGAEPPETFPTGI